MIGIIWIAAATLGLVYYLQAQKSKSPVAVEVLPFGELISFFAAKRKNGYSGGMRSSVKASRRSVKPPVGVPPVPPKTPSILFLRLGLGLLCGAAGAWALNGTHPYRPYWYYGVPLQLAFLWLVVTAFPKRLTEPETAQEAVAPVVKPSKGKTKSAPAPPVPGTVWAWCALLPAAFAAFFMYRANFPVGFTCLAIAVACLAAVRFSRGEGTAPDNLRLEKLVFPVVFLSAVVFRFALIGKNFTGLQIDEANHLLDGIRVMKGEIQSPWSVGWWANPSMPYFIIAAWFKIFGITLTAARALSVVEMSIALYFFYKWVRFYYSPGPSLAALALFSVGWWSLYYSLSPFTDGVTVTLEVLSFYLLETAVRRGDRWRWMTFGVVAAASVMTYISGRLIPGMLVATVVGWMILARGSVLKGKGRGLLAGAIFFMWMVAPFVIFLAHDPVNFFGRSKELSIFNEMNRTGDHTLILRTFAWSSVSFMGVTDGTDPRFNLPGNPMTDPVSATFILIGLVLSVFSLRSRATWVVLPGFLLGTAANAFAIQGQNPMAGYVNAQRFFLITPFYFFLAARGLEWIGHLLGRSKGSMVIRGGLVAALVVAAALNFRVYFKGIQDNKDCWESMSIPAPAYAEMLEKIYPQYHVAAHWEGYLAHLQFLLYDKVQVKILNDNDLKVPIRFNVTRDLLLMFPGWRWKKEVEQIRKIYPEAVFDDFPKEHRQEYMVILKIPKAALLREMKGSPPEGDPLP